MTFDFKNSYIHMKGITTNWASVGMVLTGALLGDSITAKATLSLIFNM